LDFSKLQIGIETKLVKLHFLSLNEKTKMIFLKVTIKVDQCESTFRLQGPLGVTDIEASVVKNYSMYTFRSLYLQV